jgi:hypothetical protein
VETQQHCSYAQTLLLPPQGGFSWKKELPWVATGVILFAFVLPHNNLIAVCITYCPKLRGTEITREL